MKGVCEMTTTWHFEVWGEDSDLFGEQFFVEVEGNLDTAKARAMAIAQENFPGELLKCWGRVSKLTAEMAGYDTY